MFTRQTLGFSLPASPAVFKKLNWVAENLVIALNLLHFTVPQVLLSIYQEIPRGINSLESFFLSGL
jgi:hypothetical protein